MSQAKLIPVEQMGWSERLAITSTMDLSDNDTLVHVCEVLNIPVSELQAQVGLAASGDVIVNLDIEPTDYSNLFDSTKIKPVQPKAKKVKEVKKRGRRGDKTANAFAAVPYEPTPVETFRQQHGLSLHVLRQQKRFDKQADVLGKVRVEVDKETKVMMIWREKPTA